MGNGRGDGQFGGGEAGIGKFESALDCEEKAEWGERLTGTNGNAKEGGEGPDEGPSSHQIDTCNT